MLSQSTDLKAFSIVCSSPGACVCPVTVAYAPCHAAGNQGLETDGLVPLGKPFSLVCNVTLLDA